MIKIIHAADFHLDSAYAALSEEQARSRRAHQRALVQKIIELGNEEQVELILLSGDLLDGRNAYYETAQVLCDAFAKSRAQIFIATGNHDPYDNASPYRSVQFPENVHFFGKESIEKVELPELDCVVYGAGFQTKECIQSQLSGFSTDDDRLSIMIMHGEVTTSSSKNNPISPSEIAASGLDYLALGHVHSHKGVFCEGKTHYAYPGTPEGRGFDELGEKGILIGTVSKGEVSLEFKSISPYTYSEYTVNIEKGDARAILSRDARFEVCRLILEGAAENANAKALEAEFQENFYKLNVIDRTTKPYDIWEAIDEDSVKGMFLRKLKASSADEETIARAAEFGIAAIENREGAR